MSEEPNMRPGYAGDPVPDVTHGVDLDVYNRNYFMGLVYKLRTTAIAKKAEAAAEAAAARHLQENLAKGKGKKKVSVKGKGNVDKGKEKVVEEKSDTPSPRLVVKLVTSIGDLFVFILLSDYYVIGFRCFGRTYYFDDFKSEFPSGTALRFNSDYGLDGLGGLDTATMNHSEFARAVLDLIRCFRDEVTLRPVFVPKKKGETQKSKLKLDKAEHNTNRREATMTTNTTPWKKHAIRIVVLMSEGARTTLVTRRAHRSQISRFARVDYIDGVSELVPHTSRARRLRALERKHNMPAQHLEYYMSGLIKDWILNWSKASDTAYLYDDDFKPPVRYATATENDIMEELSVGINDGNFFDTTIKPNRRFCAFLVQLKCKRKNWGDTQQGA